MSKNSFMKVLNFTITQQVKSKIFKISTVIILLLVFVGTSLINFIPAIKNKVDNSKSENEKNAIEISKLYYIDNSGLGTDVQSMLKPIFKDLEVVKATESEENIVESLKSTEKKEVLLSIDKVENELKVKLIRPKNTEIVSEKDCDLITSVIISNLESIRLTDAGVSSDKLQWVQTPIQSEVLKAGEASKSFEEMIAKTMLPMIVCILLFYIIYFYGYFVANSIVAEKTSRIMELLLTSVRPMQLLIGKCLAMGILAVSMFISIMITSLLSYQISGVLVKKIIDTSAEPINLAKVFSAISPSDVVWLLIFFVCGYILYAIINVIAGSTVSKIEDLQMALMPSSLLALVGFYLASIASGVGTETTIAKIAMYLPISSPFYLPSALFSQDISIVSILISLAILIVSSILLIVFAARVYSIAILHNGNRLKMKDLIGIYKNS